MVLQQAPADDHTWWTALDEDYWHALLEQGEIAARAVPPAEPKEIFESLGIEAQMGGLGSGAVAADGRDSQEDQWQVAQMALDRGEVFSLRVCGANRGGLLVEWNGLKGFLPASHLSETARPHGQFGRDAELADAFKKALGDV